MVGWFDDLLFAAVARAVELGTGELELKPQELASAAWAFAMAGRSHAPLIYISSSIYQFEYILYLLSNQIRWLGRGYPPPIHPSQHLIWLDNK